MQAKCLVKLNDNDNNNNNNKNDNDNNVQSEIDASPQQVAWYF